MSWDADLIDDRGHYEGSWNYTHNTSHMIYAVLEDAGYALGTRVSWDGKEYPASWWDRLNGMDGPEGAAYLDLIIKGLVADPHRFIAMNPENGWGDYDGLVKVLEEMRTAVPEWPCKWEASG